MLQCLKFSLCTALYRLRAAMNAGGSFLLWRCFVPCMSLQTRDTFPLQHTHRHVHTHAQTRDTFLSNTHRHVHTHTHRRAHIPSPPTHTDTCTHTCTYYLSVPQHELVNLSFAPELVDFSACRGVHSRLSGLHTVNIIFNCM